jgi:hypothetical protein
MAQRGGPYADRPPPKMRTHLQARAGSCGTICDLRSCISECQWLDSGGAAERGQNAPDCTFVELPCTKSTHWKKTLPSSVMESADGIRICAYFDWTMYRLRMRVCRSVISVLLAGMVVAWLDPVCADTYCPDHRQAAAWGRQ